MKNRIEISLIRAGFHACRRLHLTPAARLFARLAERHPGLPLELALGI